MKIMDAKYEHDLQVADETVRLTGMLIGQAIVLSGGLLELHGTVVGDVTVHAGGAVQLRGSVDGSVHNLGGALNIFGMIEGQVDHQSGTTSYYKGAIVNGVEVPTDRKVGLEIHEKP